MDLHNNKRNLSGDKDKKKKKVSRRYRKKVVSVDIKAVTEQRRETKKKQQEMLVKLKAFFGKIKSFIKKYKIAFASCTATLLVALVLLIILKPFQEKTTDEELAVSATPTPVIEEKPMTQQKIVIEAAEEDDHGLPSYLSDDLKHAILTNRDTVGFISIDDTKVYYPVVQAKDNDYYLTHTFEKSVFKTGTIYVDYKNDMNTIDQSGNYVIYGHKMMNGKMFSDLFKYKKKDFFNKHKIVKFETLKGPMEWEIFSVYAVDASVNYIKTKFRTEESYKVFLETCKNRSIYNTGVTPEPDDSIITLSTCSYEERNYRLVVQARLIKPEVQEETDSKDSKETKDDKKQ